MYSSPYPADFGGRGFPTNWRAVARQFYILPFSAGQENVRGWRAGRGGMFAMGTGTFGGSYGMELNQRLTRTPGGGVEVGNEGVLGYWLLAIAAAAGWERLNERRVCYSVIGMVK